MKYEYSLRGKNLWTGLVEDLRIVAGPIEDAIDAMSTTHEDISFVRVDPAPKEVK